MAQKIITGYTGTRHITPEMDAAAWRSTFGEGNYILSTGNQCEGSMPSINEFVIRDGVVSIQGYLGYGTHESLTIDTCATGFSRIDLVCARYAHDVGSLIDSIEYVVVKGAEVAQPNVPTPPSVHTGIIKDGANEVDFPLYQVNLEGGTVTFTRLAQVISGAMGETQKWTKDYPSAGAASHSVVQNDVENNTATGAYSTAIGRGTQAVASDQFVSGKYNLPQAGMLEVVGNGTADNARSNARTLDANGQEVLAGGLQVNRSHRIGYVNIGTTQGDSYRQPSAFIDFRDSTNGRLLGNLYIESEYDDGSGREYGRVSCGDRLIMATGDFANPSADNDLVPIKMLRNCVQVVESAGVAVTVNANSYATATITAPTLAGYKSLGPISGRTEGNGVLTNFYGTTAVVRNYTSAQQNITARLKYLFIKDV